MKQKRFGLCRNCSGTSLIISLLALVVFATLSVMVYKITRTLIYESLYQKRLAQAQSIAEAGLEDALHSLSLNSSWRSGFSSKTFADGYYTVTLSTNSPPIVTSIGSSAPIAVFGRARVQIQAQSEITAGSAPLCPNLAASSQISILASADAYDSSVNPNPTTFGFGANMCSNKKIQPLGTITINGNVYYGSPPAPSPSVVLGTINASTITWTVPAHDGSSYVSSNSNLTGMSPLTYYNAGSKTLIIPSGKSVTLQPGIYYLTQMTISSGSTLIANTSAGTVTIYLQGDCTISGTVTNSSFIPSRFAIFTQGSSNVSLQGSSGNFYGIVEGDGASISTSMTVFGKLAGSSLNIDGLLHYDIETSTQSSTTHVTWQNSTWSAKPQ